MKELQHYYNLGDEARDRDIDSNIDEISAKRNASDLCEGDDVFILRSDGKWRYATVIACNASDIEFAVKADGSTKKVGAGHWGARIRTFRRNSPCNKREYLLRNDPSIFRNMTVNNSSVNQRKSEVIHPLSEATTNGAGGTPESTKRASFENGGDFDCKWDKAIGNLRRKALSKTISGLFSNSSSQGSLSYTSLRAYHDPAPFQERDCSEQRVGRPRLTKVQSISQTISTIFVPEKCMKKSTSRSIEAKCEGCSDSATPGESSTKQVFLFENSERGKVNVHDENRKVFVDKDPSECKLRKTNLVDDVFDKHGIPLNKENPRLAKNSMSIIFKTMMSVDSGDFIDDAVYAPVKQKKIKPHLARNIMPSIFKNDVSVDNEHMALKTHHANKNKSPMTDGVNENFRRSSNHGSLRRSTCDSFGNGNLDISATSRNAFVALLAEKSNINASLRSK